MLVYISCILFVCCDSRPSWGFIEELRRAMQGRFRSFQLSALEMSVDGTLLWCGVALFSEKIRFLCEKKAQ